MDGNEVIAPDPVYNRPQSIGVGGREYRLREIVYTQLIDYLGDFQRIASQSERPIRGVEDLDYGDLLHKFADVFTRAIADATGETSQNIRELTAGDWTELALHVVTLHQRALRNFFTMAARFQAIRDGKIIDGLLGSTGNGSTKHASLSPSSAEGSA